MLKKVAPESHENKSRMRITSCFGGSVEATYHPAFLWALELQRVEDMEGGTKCHSPVCP
jgi:hypothetical protein